MQNSKLVEQLKQLSAWELRHFSDFAHSPFFNKHASVTDLVDHLLTFAPAFDAPELNRESVYAALFPDQEFQVQRCKDLFSQTMKLLRSFFAFYELKNNDYQIQRALLNAYQKRQMDRPYQKVYTAQEKAIAQIEGKLQEYHLRQLLLHETHITYLTGTMSRSVSDVVQKASDRLDVYFILSKLKYGIEMANRKRVIQQEFDTGMVPELMTYLDRNPEIEAQHPEIGIYLKIYRTLTETDATAHFERLRSDMERHANALPRLELREIHSYASNFCIRQVNAGQRQYLATLLELYQWALQHGVLIDKDGWLLQWDYKNIVSASLKAGEAAWCQQFIEQYKEKIAPEFRENAYRYNLASFHFEQQDYSRALRLLQEVEFSDVFYALGSRVILLKSYFETGNFIALNALCDAFKIYLKRNKTISQVQFAIYFNLVSFTKKAGDLAQKAPVLSREVRQRKVNELLAKMRAKGSIAQGAWLQAKVNALL